MSDCLPGLPCLHPFPELHCHTLQRSRISSSVQHLAETADTPTATCIWACSLCQQQRALTAESARPVLLWPLHRSATAHLTLADMSDDYESKRQKRLAHNAAKLAELEVMSCVSWCMQRDGMSPLLRHTVE